MATQPHHVAGRCVLCMKRQRRRGPLATTHLLRVSVYGQPPGLSTGYIQKYSETYPSAPGRRIATVIPNVDSRVTAGPACPWPTFTSGLGFRMIALEIGGFRLHSKPLLRDGSDGTEDMLPCAVWKREALPGVVWQLADIANACGAVCAGRQHPPPCRLLLFALSAG